MRFRKYRDAPLRGEDELPLAEQECGTWYGCRWKPHQPLLMVEGIWPADRNRCAECNQIIRYEGVDPVGKHTIWTVDRYIIEEEVEI